jgi:hypothetical protein
MDAAPSRHPTDQTLSSYGLGKLGDGPAEAVNKHLERCPDYGMRVAHPPKCERSQPGGSFSAPRAAYCDKA